MEQLDDILLFRWVVGLAMDAPVWDASTFSKNRKRSNRAHASTTDPEARLARKSDGKSSISPMPAMFCGTAERDAALVLRDDRPGRSRITRAADKGYRVKPFVAELRSRLVTPQSTLDTRTSKRGLRHPSAVDCRTTVPGVDRVGWSVPPGSHPA